MRKWPKLERSYKKQVLVQNQDLKKNSINVEAIDNKVKSNIAQDPSKYVIAKENAPEEGNSCLMKKQPLINDENMLSSSFFFNTKDFSATNDSWNTSGMFISFFSYLVLLLYF